MRVWQVAAPAHDKECFRTFGEREELFDPCTKQEFVRAHLPAKCTLSPTRHANLPRKAHNHATQKTQRYKRALTARVRPLWKSQTRRYEHHRGDAGEGPPSVSLARPKAKQGDSPTRQILFAGLLLQHVYRPPGSATEHASSEDRGPSALRTQVAASSATLTDVTCRM